MSLRDHLGSVYRRAISLASLASGHARRQREKLDGSRAAILMYHRVLPRDHAAREHVEPGMFVAPESFETHLDCLKEHFDVRPLHEIVAMLTAGEALPPRACAITFDDGWLDNLTHAAPLLEARALPATIFAVSERVGTQGAFWTDEVVPRLEPLSAGEIGSLALEIGADPGTSTPLDVLEFLKRCAEEERPAKLEAMRSATDEPDSRGRALLDWSELDRLDAAGIDIEVHGATHAILTGLNPDGIRRELESALSTLRDRGHARHGLLAYPSGRYDDDVIHIAQELGYRAAVTTQTGLAAPHESLLTLPRIGLHDDVSRTPSEFLRRVPGAAAG